MTSDPSLPYLEVSESPQYNVCHEHIIPHIYYLHECWIHPIILEILLFRKKEEGITSQLRTQTVEPYLLGLKFGVFINGVLGTVIRTSEIPVT